MASFGKLSRTKLLLLKSGLGLIDIVPTLDLIDNELLNLMGSKTIQPASRYIRSTSRYIRFASRYVLFNICTHLLQFPYTDLKANRTVLEPNQLKKKFFPFPSFLLERHSRIITFTTPSISFFFACLFSIYIWLAFTIFFVNNYVSTMYHFVINETQ